MNRVEQIRQQLADEENDIIALGLENKLLREQRLEKFEQRWLPEIELHLGEKAIVYDSKKSCYTMVIPKTKVKVDFYPMANKVLIRHKNKWVKPGLRWLIKELGLEKQ